MADGDFIPPNVEHNPYIKILSTDLILNAEGFWARRRTPKEIRHPIIRFLEKIRVSEVLFYNGIPCWEWIGCISSVTGYGQFKVDGRRGAKRSGPHQFAYLYFIGPMPDGMEPDHLCNVHHCANPLHLEAVTHAENMRRRSERQRKCKYDHEFTEENTYYDKTGKRKCRECNRLRVAAFYEKNPGYNARMCQNYQAKLKHII